MTKPENPSQHSSPWPQSRCGCHTLSTEPSARAKMRFLVKRILKKFGYPPDLGQEAVQTVLAQAELLLQEIAPTTAK